MKYLTLTVTALLAPTATGESSFRICPPGRFTWYVSVFDVLVNLIVRGYSIHGVMLDFRVVP